MGALSGPEYIPSYTVNPKPLTLNLIHTGKGLNRGILHFEALAYPWAAMQVVGCKASVTFSIGFEVQGLGYRVWGLGA